MAKQKIKTINGKRLVVGNVNELTNNETLVEQKGDSISLKERVNGEIKELSKNTEQNSKEMYKYYDVTNSIHKYLISLAQLAKYYQNGNNVMIASTAKLPSNSDYLIISVKVNLNDKVYLDGNWKYIADVIKQAEVYYGEAPQITEEEFYFIPEPGVYEGDIYYYRLDVNKDNSRIIKSDGSGNTISGIGRVVVSKIEVGMMDYRYNMEVVSFNKNGDTFYAGSSTVPSDGYVTACKFVVGPDLLDLFAVANKETDQGLDGVATPITRAQYLTYGGS